MKKEKHITLAILGLLGLVFEATFCHAQGGFRRYPGTPIEELRELAAKEDLDAIFRIGERRDTASLPLLMKWCKPLYKPQQPRRESSLGQLMESAPLLKQIKLSLEARRAVARMGVHPDISDYTACLADPKTYNKEPCITALGYIGDIKAVKHLAPLLKDDGSPPHSKHELTFRYSEWTARALGEILPDVQARFMLKSPNSTSHLEQWRKWWEKREGLGEESYSTSIIPTTTGFRKLFRKNGQ